jgi:hypothetical protein
MYLYSITSLARPIKGNGIFNPSALAVLRLIINSTLVTCWTGKVAGFSPLRIRSVRPRSWSVRGWLSADRSHQERGDVYRALISQANFQMICGGSLNIDMTS